MTKKPPVSAVRIGSAKPMNFSGVPFAMVVVAFLLILVPVRVGKLWQLSIFGWLILFASWGTSVEIKEGVLVLRYFFGKFPVKIKIHEIEEINVINRLERAALVRHFPWMAGLFLTVILYAFVDFIMLPNGMLRGYYYGDVGLIVFGLAYMGAWNLPFRKGLYARLFAVFSIVLGVFLIRVKTGSFEGDDVFFVSMWGFIIFLLLEQYYNMDYIIIKTAGRSYLIAVEGKRDEGIRALLEGISNV